MALALEEVLGGHVEAGVVSAQTADLGLPGRWRVFSGGHPLPNEESLRAARAVFGLLEEADDEASLILFLISGGGSAMMEWPRGEGLTLEHLREASRQLVACGAGIAEVNAVRRALSAVKGGGLTSLAPRAAQVTLIVSDVSPGRPSDVASGPTLPPDGGEPSAVEVLARYGLTSTLPEAVVRAVKEFDARAYERATGMALRKHHVLLDNARAVESAARAARARGLSVEVATDLVEQNVEEGAAEMVSRLASLYARRGAEERAVCLLSGGEFACPVRGRGIGGRSSETALRCAFEIERLRSVEGRELPGRIVVLCAGTDGIDGNSPAAGALADETTLLRGREMGLDAANHLEESDSHTFFARLGDDIVTGPTGTNVRDLRILIAAPRT